jgi:hypothetical protein
LGADIDSQLLLDAGCKGSKGKLECLLVGQCLVPLTNAPPTPMLMPLMLPARSSKKRTRLKLIPDTSTHASVVHASSGPSGQRLYSEETVLLNPNMHNKNVRAEMGRLDPGHLPGPPSNVPPAIETTCRKTPANVHTLFSNNDSKLSYLFRMQCLTSGGRSLMST